MTREEWLVKGVDLLRPMFDANKVALPPLVHVSIGFPSRGGLSARRRTLGQCWGAEASKDKNCQIFISPVHESPIDVLDTLTHELVHVVTPGAAHRGKFITVSKAIGLTKGKPTCAAAGDELRATLDRLAEKLGPLPHYALSPGFRLTKQGTRMVKCECPDCGYTARTTRKWLDSAGAPICPACRIETEVVETIARLNGEGAA